MLEIRYHSQLYIIQSLLVNNTSPKGRRTMGKWWSGGIFSFHDFFSVAYLYSPRQKLPVIHDARVLTWRSEPVPRVAAAEEEASAIIYFYKSQLSIRWNYGSSCLLLCYFCQRWYPEEILLYSYFSFLFWRLREVTNTTILWVLTIQPVRSAPLSVLS